MLKIGIIAVSYTHLDVYKRQTEKYSRPTVTLLEDNSVLALKDEKDIKDVYKRQR